MAQQKRTISETVADYVHATTFADLPSEVVEKAKLCILDTIGCSLAGSDDRVAHSVANHAERYGGQGSSSIIGRDSQVAPQYAALANGTAAHVLDWDDGHPPSGDHIGGVIVPAAMAMAQYMSASGSELIAAVGIGYDVMGRVGEATCLPRGPGRYFHGNGVNGVFGVAAAASKLLHLDLAQTASALGLAGDGASGLREFRPTGTDCKALHVGRAGHTGISAALLAQDGLEGSTTIFEGRHGFLGAISPQPRPERIVMDLGRRWSIIESGFKLYPCVGNLHLPIEAALTLRAKHDLSPADIGAIRIGLPREALDDYGGTASGRQRPPQTVGNARFSMSFVVAAALGDGEISPRQFTQAKLMDPTITELERRVAFVPDDEAQVLYDAQAVDEPFFFTPCALEIDAGGSTYRHLVPKPIGWDPLTRPLTLEQIVAKFHSATGSRMPSSGASGAATWLLGLETQDTVDGLARILSGSVRNGASPVALHSDAE